MTERRFPDMWLDPEDDPRDAAVTRGERENLFAYLRHYRKTFELKCDGLDIAQLAQRSVPPSTLSMLGLLRHLTSVEYHWSRRVLQAQDLPHLYGGERDRDADFNGATADPAVAAEAWTNWRREVADADTWLAGDSLDRLVEIDGDQIEVRDIIVHLIEEYARHVGHADLLRECIDGRTGQ